MPAAPVPAPSAGSEPTAFVTVLAPHGGAEALAVLAEAVRAVGGEVTGSRETATSPVHAVELAVAGAAVAALRPSVRAVARTTGLDAATRPAGQDVRARRLVVTDVDSTLVQQEVIELLAAHAGREAEVAAVTERAMRGELDFTRSLHARVATLAGLPVAVLDDVLAAVRLSPGADVLCTTADHLGWPVGVVSGGFAEVVAPLAARLGIRHALANRLEVSGGRLTGRVVGDVVDRAAKAAALRRFAALEGVPLERTVGVGDGANDLDLLATAGTGIAYNAKPALRDAAEVTVSVPRLDAVLLLLGLTEADLVIPGS